MTTAATDDQRDKSGWRPWHVVVAAVFVGLAVFAAWTAWADIARLAARDEESSQIWLAIPICIYLVAVRSKRLTRAPQQHLWIGPALVGLGWAMMVVGDRELWQSVWHAGAVVMAIGAALSLLGGSVARRIVPALLALAFLVPVPARVRHHIAIPMQQTVASTAAFTLNSVGTDVKLTGNVIIINGEQVAVAEACNGMRMTFALFAACYALAFSLPLVPWVRLLILACAPLVAVVCNVIRIVPTVWLYGNASDGLADFAHTAGGWVMLVIAFVVMLWLLKLLEKSELPIFRLPPRVAGA
ncbi:MAG: exosortase/archaeosortase family protein [Planctomycetota bacterium]